MHSVMAEPTLTSVPAAERSSARELIPDRPSIPKLTEAARACQACDLYRDATQTVFGEGPATAEVMLVGEQPGDREDLEGHPFVGPAGQLLDRALDEARIDRRKVYITNVVKHKVLVCLGATAAQAVIGRQFRVTQHRGEIVDTDFEPLVTATVHPSSIL